MTRKLTESAIEDFAIKLFERLGYSYIYAPDIAPDGGNPERSHYDKVLLTGRQQPSGPSDLRCPAEVEFRRRWRRRDQLRTSAGNSPDCKFN